MKKILAIILSVAMIATMLAVSVSAADKQVVVGDNGGVTDFADTTTGGQDINVKVTDITHKYAVDVTFGLSDLTIGGSITWNVDTMKYDVAGSTLTDTTQTIEVSNRSDLPVYAYATISNDDAADGITVKADKDSDANKLTVAKATAGSGATNGTATSAEINISITSANWNTVAEYYAAKKLAAPETTTYKVATVTVTISKN